MSLDPIVLDERSTSRWERFMEGRAEGTPTALWSTWARCRNGRIDPRGPEAVESIDSQSRLAERRQRLDPSWSIVRPLFENLAARLARHDFVSLFADADGVLLYSRGGGAFERIAREVRLIEGAHWHEQVRGTNAIGTALWEGRPMSVVGCAHFERTNHELVCHGYPVRGPDGQIIGLIDATSLVHNAGKPIDLVIATAVDGMELALRQAATEKRSSALRTVVPRVRPRRLDDRDPFAALVGSDPGLASVVDRARRFAATDVPVLALAETGTGKELLARAIHAASPRKSSPMVALHCGGLAPNLIASQLFGYVGGAFTGALRQGQPGLLEQADGGTLFLDELAEMPPPLQALLLRVLEDGTFSRVGEGRVRRTNVRLVCATCRDLDGLVDAGAFRRDLYYRIRGATLRLPALKQRTDVLELAEHFLEVDAHEHGHGPKRLSIASRAALRAHDWPGNVRELRAALRHAVVLADHMIEPMHLPADVAARGASTKDPARVDPAADRPRSRFDAEAELVRQAIEASRGNLSGAARRLGVARSTLYRMLERHGLR